MHDCASTYAPLCHLINHSLSPFTPTSSPLSKQIEKTLLITLSQISRTIREWENLEETDCHDSSNGFHGCFANIVCLLTNFLSAESQFVRHSTTNVLAAVSSLLVNSGNEWETYLQLLCVCLVTSVSITVSPTSTSMISATVESGSDFASSIFYVQNNIVDSNWHTVVCLVRVLRIIVKNMKQCPDGELVEIYMNSINYALMNIPWELLNEILVAKDKRKELRFSNGLSGKFDSSVSLYVFLGTLLQLFCSLLHQSTSMEVSTLKEHPVIDRIISLVPRLLRWCFHKEDGSWTSSSHYFKHKTLMLMIRLIFRVHQDSSLLALWLQLLHEYFESLLYQPISQRHSNLIDCLDGSPFLSRVSDGQKVHRTCITHLQRQAIFLFLKCSTSLIKLGKVTDTKCSCAFPSSCFTYELHSDLECCSSRKGLLELSEWLNRHVPLDVLVDYELYLEKCSHFTSSFLQLYMDEDDFLFEVLLHLSTLPLPIRQMECKQKEEIFKEFKGDILFHLSNVFDTVHLFHLFLAELNYDHSVLLDYLISKDAGIHCLQYLLRCLRAVSNSWNLFLEFPVCGAETVLFSCKKRKLSAYGSDFDRKVELSSDTVKGCKYPEIYHNGSETNNKFGSMLSDTRNRTLQNAKSCLFSLKSTIENLHQKDLFPYNPAALLRSFARFQELCHQQQSVYLQETGKMS